jgi:hypothetical protein
MRQLRAPSALPSTLKTPAGYPVAAITCARKPASGAVGDECDIISIIVALVTIDHTTGERATTGGVVRRPVVSAGRVGDDSDLAVPLAHAVLPWPVILDERHQAR